MNVQHRTFNVQHQMEEPLRPRTFSLSLFKLRPTRPWAGKNYVFVVFPRALP